MQADKPLSTEINAQVPTAARMYDYYLGGKDNYAADRAAVEELDKVVPSTRALALNNRRFLQRVCAPSPRSTASGSSRTTAPACPRRTTCTR
ncbi:hypothetical protein SFUMM280S_11347 [Streptomyces fumanus]